MSQADIEIWLTDPQVVRPNTTMPDLPLEETQIRELAAFLSTLRDAPEPESDPPPAPPDAETEGPDIPPEDPQ
jgi:cytochrome c1